VYRVRGCVKIYLRWFLLDEGSLLGPGRELRVLEAVARLVGDGELEFVWGRGRHTVSEARRRRSTISVIRRRGDDGDGLRTVAEARRVLLLLLGLDLDLNLGTGHRQARAHAVREFCLGRILI
jgi:hypothetical protein